MIECNECHKAFHQRCHSPKIPDSVIQERINDPRFIWKCESCNQEFAKVRKSCVGGIDNNPQIYFLGHERIKEKIRKSK